MTKHLHRYMAWDADYYDSKSRMWPHDHEIHGPFFAADDDDLKSQIRRAGLNVSDVRWEITETPTTALSATLREGK